MRRRSRASRVAAVPLLASMGVLVMAAGAAAQAANPLIPAGDPSLRHDIQLLADAGIVRGPVTTWPLAWGPILADLERASDETEMTAAVSLAMARVRQRAEREVRGVSLRFRAGLSGAESPARIRGFADTPRESGEIAAGLSWRGDTITVELNGQAAASPDDGEEFRADGSLVGATLGNFTIAASTLDRWWGPGWDGGLILSSNARPIPALTLDRSSTEPFESRWLSWIGPWDLSLIAGRLESDRAVPEAQFLGFRLSIRPLRSLEIGLSRTAQWCGEERPCDLDAFTNLLLGRDNRGDAGIGSSNEPGNQLAGVDVRWSTQAFGRRAAVYGEFVGEDEAGGFPSKFLGLAGAEIGGVLRENWSWHGFVEIASTKCRFYQADDDYDCAYNHGIYRTGYRYRGRSIGHGSDNDSLVLSTGFLLVDQSDMQWRLLARYGELNRGGEVDSRNMLTPVKQELASLDVVHGRTMRYGIFEVGVGVQRLETDTEARAFLEWRTSR